MSYHRLIESVGALVMGATTYRWILEHDVGDGSGRARPGPALRG